MDYAERALRTLSAGNRTLLRAQGEHCLLRDMCRAIVEVGGYRMAWVGYRQHDAGQTIRPMAFHGMEEGFLGLGEFTWADGPRDRGPTARAVATGVPAVVQDIRALHGDALPVPPEELLRRGYAAVAAFPLRIDGEVIGNLTIFAAEADAFGEREVTLLGEMADDLGFGIGVLRDRVRHLEAEETIRLLAYTDPVTTLPNRAALKEALAKALEAAAHQHHPLAVLLVEIGRYQEISDTLGYHEGDALLLAMAGRLQERLAAHVVARVGEDEFAFWRFPLGAEDALQFASALSRELCEPVELGGLAIDAHVHVGVAMFPGHGCCPDELLRRAKIAAVQARQLAGKCALYKGAADQESRRRLALVSDLRRAIDSDELRLYCQPKVDIVSGDVVGAEALVRWAHPERGEISTGEFVALAEHAGLIMPLTRWVLDAAFRQAHAWFLKGFAYPLSVNLSAQDLRDPRLVDRISGLFSTWAIPPSLIQFELTESAMMEDPGGALDSMQRLKALGVDLFVDDFGTGYSSLSYLQRLPVSALKIDQSFVAGMLANAGSAAIVRSTIELGHNLGLAVVAEGVESEPLWNGLRELGCDTAQGYYVGRPVPVAEFTGWVDHSVWHPHPAAGMARGCAH